MTNQNKRNIKNQMPEQNGIRMPRKGTQSRVVWDLADQLTAKLRKKDPDAVTPVQPLLKVLGDTISDLNIRNQYSRWRKFHGITGRHV